jgi:hypothetical protein
MEGYSKLKNELSATKLAFSRKHGKKKGVINFVFFS